MNMHSITILAALWLPAMASAQEAPKPIPMRHMAFGIELTPMERGGVQTVLLPAEVYRSCTSPDLSDIRVYNGAGEEIPHAMRPWMQTSSEEAQVFDLPYFPIYGEAEEIAGAFALELKRGPEGEVLAVQSGPSTNREQPLIAHVIDALRIPRPIRSIEVDWVPGKEDFLAAFSLESSSDLATWQVIVPHASFASLSRDDAQLEQRRVEFPPCSQPYLRLRWIGKALPRTIAQVRATGVQHHGLPERRSVRLRGIARQDAAHTFDFMGPGPLRPIAVQVHLPQPNSLVQATVEQATSEQGPWRTAITTQFFRLNGEVEHQNAAYPIEPGASTHWSLRVEPNGGGLGQGTPVLELFYYPHQLAFLARGEGPYTLTYGSYGAPSSDFKWSDIQPMLLAQKDFPAQSVSLHRQHELSGSAALKAPAPPSTTFKRAILWAVLIAGVALLGWLSLRLIRQLQETDAGTSSP